MVKKVLVAMSGGVDSSVAAALLVKQGYFVAGAYMKNFSTESWKGVIEPDCPWEQDVADAKAVCKKLSIDFFSLNFEKEYRKDVIEYFFSEYKAGRTPNPDVMCNKEIKFGRFLEKARDLGFDYIATGHYARVREIPNPKSQFPNYELRKGLDSNKDQSYFLYTLTQDQLAHTLFPIGKYTKPKVRQLAKKFGLVNADKKDSQGVCFVGHIKLKEFLGSRLKPKVGVVLDSKGKKVGEHQGAWFYTLGQRHGFGGGGGSEPHYIAAKNIKKNQLIVATMKERELLFKSELVITNMHWIAGKAPKRGTKLTAKIRYRQPGQGCAIFPSPGLGRVPARLAETSRGWGGQERSNYKVKFTKPQFAPAPGQSIVFYSGQTCLGGGVIK